MKIILLISLLALAACSSGPVSVPQVDAPEVSTPDMPTPVQVDPDAAETAIQALSPKITVVEFINHTASEKERNLKALESVKETIQGQCFQKGLMDRALIQTNGKTNAEVLQSFLEADIKVRLEMYRNRWVSTVGYTYPNSDTIWMNRKFYDFMGPCDVGSNLAHEIIGHKLGYGHDAKASVQRQFSVPYSLNVLIEKCCQEKK